MNFLLLSQQYSFRDDLVSSLQLIEQIKLEVILLNGKMPMLVKIRGYSLGNYLDEGRLTHRDGDMKWEDVFYNWLKRKSSINV